MICFSKQMMMIAILVADIPINHPAVFASYQHHVTLNGASREDDHPGANPAIVTDTTSQYRAVGWL